MCIYKYMYTYIYIYTHICVYISVRRKCCVPVGCDHMRAEKCDSSTCEEKRKKNKTKKKNPQMGQPVGPSAERPQSAPRPWRQPSMAMGQQVLGLTGADDGDAWHCCSRDGDPHGLGQRRWSLDALLPPWIPRGGRAWRALPPRLLCQGQGHAIPSIEGWRRNPTSAARGGFVGFSGLLRYDDGWE